MVVLKRSKGKSVVALRYDLNYISQFGCVMRVTLAGGPIILFLNVFYLIFFVGEVGAVKFS